MLIKYLSVHNFKSLKEENIEFTPLTMLVGANASGKSNLINIFRFISNIATEGIDNAIALQGGIPYLSNVSLSKGEPIRIAFTIDLSMEGWIRNLNAKSIGLGIQGIKYAFTIQPNLKGHGYHIATDKLEMHFNCLKINQGGKKEERYSKTGASATFVFERKSVQASAQVHCAVEPENILDKETCEKIMEDVSARAFCSIINDDKKELMLYRLAILLPPSFSENTFIRIFDFDPKELKKASSMASTRILKEDGSNIASVLQTILRTKDDRKKFTTLLNQFLPFVNSVTIENNLDRSFSYKIQESFSKRSFNANFLSDGTVSIIAIIIALYFEPRTHIIILEEPERNIHPKLLSNVLSAAEDVSTEKQIIITTHNPEFLKHAKIENVKLMHRDDQGFSLLSNPKDSLTVKCFIQNDLGLDDLFLQGMLEE